MVAEDAYSRIKKVIATHPEKKHKDLAERTESVPL
jgi:hypothetical protein